LPTPPFWLVIAMIRPTFAPLLELNRDDIPGTGPLAKRPPGALLVSVTSGADGQS
jgi:hypothetical protein